MWIQVRTMDGSKSARIDGLSKLSKIEDLRLRVKEQFDVEPALQRLFYRGKQVRHLNVILALKFNAIWRGKYRIPSIRNSMLIVMSKITLGMPGWSVNGIIDSRWVYEFNFTLHM